MVSNYAEKINNCNATRKLKSSNNKLLKVEAKKEALEQETVESVLLKRTVVPVTCEVIKYEAQELAKFHITQYLLKASTVVCVNIMQRYGFSPQRRTSLCQKLPADFEKKFPAIK